SAQTACGQWHVSLSSGELDGETIICDQLRLGAIAAWWMSRDGAKAGVVQRKNNNNILHVLSSDEQDNIARAFMLARGEIVPELIRLPCIPITADESQWP
ncbi:MAG: DUF3450 family protein, partial [Planctomycetes bacterium]|nr:DUF3450 family protein [Planctomycetota bacterium]